MAQEALRHLNVKIHQAESVLQGPSVRLQAFTCPSSPPEHQQGDNM